MQVFNRSLKNMMRSDQLYAILISFILVASTQAAQLTTGTDISEATQAMKEAGYSKSGLDMGSRNRDHRLAYWSVDEGILIVVYSLKTKSIIGISYWFSDERPKASRKTFQLDVKNFDTKTGAMVIQTKKPKRKQGAAHKPATNVKPEAKDNAKLKPKPEPEPESKRRSQ